MAITLLGIVPQAISERIRVYAEKQAIAGGGEGGRGSQIDSRSLFTSVWSTDFPVGINENVILMFPSFTIINCLLVIE